MGLTSDDIVDPLTAYVFFGLVPLCVSDIPAFRVLENVLMGPNLQIGGERQTSFVVCHCRCEHHVRMFQALDFHNHCTLPSFAPFAYQHPSVHNTVRWNLFHQAPQLPEHTFQFDVLGTISWSVRNDEINCLALGNQIKAHRHKKPFVCRGYTFCIAIL